MFILVYVLYTLQQRPLCQIWSYHSLKFLKDPTCIIYLFKAWDSRISNMTFMCVKCKIYNYSNTQIQNYKLPICAIFFEKLGVQWYQLWHSHVTYTKGVAWTFVCQHSYFCSGLTAKDVLNSCSESTRIIYNVIQFAETDRREWCKAFYCILVVLTIRWVAIKSRALLNDKLKNIQQLSVLFYWNLKCYQYVLQSTGGDGPGRSCRW